MDTDTGSDTLNIISISGVVLGFIVQISIGVVACRGMLQSKTDLKLRGLFIVSWLASFITFIIYIAGNVLELNTGEYPAAMKLSTAYTSLLFFIFLLLTVVLRLRLTFKDSIYRMSQRVYYMFIGICCLLIVIPSILRLVFDVGFLVCVASFLCISFS